MEDNERVGKLEVAFQNIEQRIKDIDGTLKKIQDVVSKSRETNWSLIFAAAAIGLTLWAAAIRPLNADVERQQSVAAELAKAVLIQNDKVEESKIEIAILKYRLENGGGK